jgi:hypothetical protein
MSRLFGVVVIDVRMDVGEFFFVAIYLVRVLKLLESFRVHIEKFGQYLEGLAC